MSVDAKDPRLVLELVGDARAPVELPRQGVMTIGSSRDKADVHVEGQGVADLHCAIGRIKGGGWALKDLGSPYGTIVNGEKVQSRRIEAGDLVLLGSRRLKVVDGDAVAARKPAPPEPAAKASEAASAPKLQVKGYRLERPLGRGGMGEVYLAVQESLGRPVALKVLAAKLAADADFVRRFQAEARAAAALNHPNVVTVHDVWEDGGRHLLAMEYMDRGNLEQRIAREGRLTSKEGLDILHDAAKALVYAELRGIVHRDIKPANLMQNSVGTTKLADLGLAMHLEAEATESDNKKIFGTPHFISPEQARGEKVDVRSDMYSLGATLYRLLSGRTPFEGATTRDILRGHFLEEPRPLAEGAPGIDPALASLIHRLLAKKPDQRFSSAGALLQEVERLRSAVLHGAPAQAAPQKKSHAGLVLVVVALLVAGGVAAKLLSDGGASPPSNAGTPGSRETVAGPPPVERDPDRVVETVPPKDDDTAIKLRELEAENELMRIPSDLDAEARKERLSALAERFAGTGAAGKAAEEADRIRMDLARAAAASSARDLSKRTYVERIQLAARTDDAPKPIGEALRAMIAAEMPADLAEDPQALAERRGAFAAVVVAARDRVSGSLAKAKQLASEGRFDDYAAALRSLQGELDLPPMPPGLGFEDIPELGDLIGYGGAVRKLLDGLEGTRSDFAKGQVASDSRKLATGLRGPEGFEGALRTLDFASAGQRLGALEASLATPEARGFVQDLSAGLAKARATLASVVSEFDRGGWRRKTFNDPRVKGRSQRDALGANAQGILIKAETGADSGTDLVPWSAFAGRTAELHQLFHQRLAREYSKDELAGIEALLRLSAVVHVVDETSETLVPGSTNVLTAEEARAMLEGFETARTWSEACGSTAALDREVEATRVLVVALQAAAQGAWASSVADLERLLSDFRGTLLVRLLSDGR